MEHKYFTRSKSPAFAKMVHKCMMQPNGKPYKYYAFNSLTIESLDKYEVLGTEDENDFEGALEITDFI